MSAHRSGSWRLWIVGACASACLAVLFRLGWRGVVGAWLAVAAVAAWGHVVRRITD